MISCPQKRTILITLICCITLSSLSFYAFIDSVPGYVTIISRHDVNRNNITKTILFWTTMFGDKNFYFGSADPFAKCPVNNCYATSNKSYMDIVDFDAMLFHGNEMRNWPSRRSLQQWYVYVNLESPEHRKVPAKLSRDYFNLTMTYRLDSDIVWSYAVVKDIRTNEIVAPLVNTTWQPYENRVSLKLSKIIRGKEKAVSWIVSNCKAKSGREAYVKELSKHIEVDVYGKCGPFKCSRSTDCHGKLVEPRYFFYLSFENSLCRDYVTEKLYDALRYNTIPIVYGGANYSIFAPAKSYIDALDFNVPEDLAKYLKFLMRNPEEYAKYFAWKNYYYIDRDGVRAECRLCAFLHQKTEPKSYKSLSDWYAEDVCPIQRIVSDHRYATKANLAVSVN